jgi:hypothetical protein
VEFVEFTNLLGKQGTLRPLKPRPGPREKRRPQRDPASFVHRWFHEYFKLGKMLRAVLLLALLIAVVGAKNLRKDAKSYEGPITLGAHTYASREEFVKSGKRCGTKEPTSEELFAVQQKLASIPHELDHAVPGLNRMATVNVHFHIIKTTQGAGAVSQTDIDAQLQVMNDAYHQVNAKFVLKGVHTVVNNAWFDLSPGSQEEHDMKTSLRIGGANVLNVYTATNSDGILGWATFPWDAADNLGMDGVVIDYQTLPNGSMEPYNEGATLVHEAGHWMGLLHTFQGGCAKYADQGDLVKDTPCVSAPNFGCPADSTNSCPGTAYAYKGNDLVHNYMDYVDDDCMYQFTKGQKQRMRQNWLAYRKGH